MSDPVEELMELLERYRLPSVAYYIKGLLRDLETERRAMVTQLLRAERAEAAIERALDIVRPNGPMPVWQIPEAVRAALRGEDA